MNNYIVSLTTIPTKFDNLHLTIDSIISQTILPSKIVVNIPNMYNFRMNGCTISESKISDFMSKYSGFNVFINRIDEDYGPGTKLLGLLNSSYITNIDISNTYIILIDDDLIYKPYMIEHFDKIIHLYNNIEVCSYFVYNCYNSRIGQGSDGFLMKLNLLDNFVRYYNVIKHEDYLKYHDDFYISYYFNLISKTIQYIKPPNNCLIYDTHPNTFVDALSRINWQYSRHNLNLKSNEIFTKLNSNGKFRFLDIENIQN